VTGRRQPLARPESSILTEAEGQPRLPRSRRPESAASSCGTAACMGRRRPEAGPTIARSPLVLLAKSERRAGSVRPPRGRDRADDRFSRKPQAGVRSSLNASEPVSIQMSPSAMHAVFCVSCRPGALSNSLRRLVQADRQQGLCKDRARTFWSSGHLGCVVHDVRTRAMTRSQGLARARRPPPAIVARGGGGGLHRWRGVAWGLRSANAERLVVE
jgi:hypothetical protein